MNKFIITSAMANIGLPIIVFFSYILGALPSVYVSPFNSFADNQLFKSEQALTANAFLGFTLPVDILGLSENANGFINAITYDKAFVKCPISTNIYNYKYNGQKGCWFKILNYSVYLVGLEVCTIEDGKKYKSGEIIGSLSSNVLQLKVFYKDNKIALSTLRKLVGV